MIDISTAEPMRVSSGGQAGPYIMVPVVQLDEVQAILDAHQIPYSVDEYAISLDGEPEITVIDLGRSVDAKQVQNLLDSAK